MAQTKAKPGSLKPRRRTRRSSARPRATKSNDGHESAETERATAQQPDRGPLAVVCLGASAGGLEPLEAFFTALPAESGVAFVVLTHQHAESVSMMAMLLGRRTSMPVVEVSEPTRLDPNRVYTVRPGYHANIEDGILYPAEPAEATRPALPIDYCFTSLALDQAERAIGIVLSGTGSDGTQGIAQIKAQGGLVLVQDRESAQYDGMPSSAAQTGLADAVLPPAEMPGKVLEYVHGLPPRDAVRRDAGAESMQPLFALIRQHTGRDFSQYKASTVGRRIDRRIRQLHLDGIAAYVRYIRGQPSEIDLLCKDLLIGVTSFFRDPAAWASLGEALTKQLQDKPNGYLVRAWVPGCSTGEEAYSLAILLREVMQSLKRAFPVHIFATDLDGAAIETARTGVYPSSAAAQLSPERLASSFIQEDGRLRVRREVRDMLVFATQNLIADPPFTRLDVLLCRNLLIYMDSELQRTLLPVLHYSLKPDGLLLLGSSESIGPYADLFATVDKKWKLFRRQPAAIRPRVATLAPVFADPLGGLRAVARVPGARPPEVGTVADAVGRMLLRDLVPPTVVVQEHGQVVHVHGRTGRFLEPAQGTQISANILDMARPGLKRYLSAALREAIATEREVFYKAVPFTSNGQGLSVDLRVRPLTEPTGLNGLLRVSFEHADHPGAVSEAEPDRAQHEQAAQFATLEQELSYVKESHQATIEELETANEQLKSTNEELQSTNEELQSANEELETSKEEMQSLNEEMQTVNAELQGKVDELSGANNDMKNLLNGTDIATLFLDKELRIKRYTEQAKKVVRLIPTDVGRPMADLVSTLRYDHLVDDAREVLRTLVFKEIEVDGDDGHAYLMRILPYRTTENVIDGLVLTFVDVSKINALRNEQQRVVEVLRSSPVSVFGQDRNLEFTWTACNSLFGRISADLVGKTDAFLFGAEDGARLEAFKQRVITSGIAERTRMNLVLAGVRRTYDVYVRPERVADGNVVGVACVVIELDLDSTA